MLIVNKDGSVELTRGDTARLTITIMDDDGEPYVVKNDDVLTMTVKLTVDDDEPCFTKTVTGGNVIHIKPEDTASLDFGKYIYDVELATHVDEEVDVYTIIEKTTFKIREEVTRR